VRVRDERGAPVAGARVEAVGRVGAEGASATVRRATAGADGVAVLGPLVFGAAYDLAARAGGHAPAARAGWTGDPAVFDPLVDLVAERAPRRLEVRAAPPGARLRLWRDGRCLGEGTAGAAGLAMLDAPAGALELTVERAGALAAVAVPPDAADVEGEPGDEREVSWTVRGAGGGPLALARVRAFVDVAGARLAVEAFTDRSGVARLRLGGAMTARAVRVEREGWAAVERAPAPEGAVTLAPAPAVRGLVRDRPTGAPVRGAWFRAVSRLGPATAWYASDDLGRFHLPDVPPDALELEIRSDGHRTARAPKTVLSTIFLERAPWAAVRVVGPDGEPRGGVRVAHADLVVETDAAGRARLPLPDGLPATLRVHAPGRAPLEVPLAAPPPPELLVRL
jgi:hypothetical protein